jgi:hypothetical protein
MSYYSAKPIHLNLQPSILLASIISFVVLMMSVFLILLPLNAAFKWPLLALMMVASVYSIRRYALLTSATSVIHLSLTQTSKLQLTYKDAKQAEVRVLESSFVSPYLTVLNLQEIETGRRLSIVLLPDSAESIGFRQLRVWLRWGRDVLSEPSSAR